MINIGDYVCVRARDQGCVLGILELVSGRECDLAETRQIYNWEKSALTLQDVILQDPKISKVKLSRVNKKGGRMTEVCGIWHVPDELVEKFKNYTHS